MDIRITGHVPVKGDCGHQFEVPITGIEGDFECPVCGAKDRFSEEQAQSIRDELRRRAAEFGTKKVAEAFRGKFPRGR